MRCWPIVQLGRPDQRVSMPTAAMTISTGAAAIASVLEGVTAIADYAGHKWPWALRDSASLAARHSAQARAPGLTMARNIWGISAAPEGWGARRGGTEDAPRRRAAAPAASLR